jgi:phenylacetate-coenzyme A ligase PaaK-like adenylate-forming protein
MIFNLTPFLSRMFPVQQKIFSVDSDDAFEQMCLHVFALQYKCNDVYRRYCDLLGVHPKDVRSIEAIPFLPVELFKSHRVQCGNAPPELIFTSSGTAGTEPSRHYVNDLKIYNQSMIRSFELLYGQIENFTILALLPSYLERKGSSLVYMVERFMEISNHPGNGFYLYDHQKLKETIERLTELNRPVLLLGVSFALLDFAEKFSFSLPDNFIVMETGGMKGRQREMVREELHGKLCRTFGVGTIHSEYGMTELLSQAYSKGSGRFTCPPWMKTMIRDTNDPLSYIEKGKTGAINIVDLANVNSCSFIATQDLGKINEDDSFEVLGRFDNSDVRGCNLLVV